jgi:DNA-directed RNA polymerase subunit K/omega
MPPKKTQIVPNSKAVDNKKKVEEDDEFESSDESEVEVDDDEFSEEETEEEDDDESSVSSIASEEIEDNEADNDEEGIYRLARKKHDEEESDEENEEELVFDDDDKKFDEIVKPTERITKPILTKFERVRILGDRAKQISLGAKPMVKGVIKLSPIDIAKLELEKGVIPLIIERPMPNGKKERWFINELQVIN